jgi:ubiquinone/menaquinone biosynthesis C-methylase UbiE
MIMSNSGYLETEDKLRIRIHAHTAYTNFQLEDWLSEWLSGANGYRLLEIGCGDGNFFPTYAQVLGQKGFIIGCDSNHDLLRRARVNSLRLVTPVMILPWNFDVHPYPLLDEEVDVLTAPFCAYYASNVSGWIEDSLRVVKRGGKLLLLGPTKDNAQELYQLNEMVTGIRSLPETDETSTKLEEVFLAKLQVMPGCEVKRTILDRQIIFPNAKEFARYYRATWLCEKTQEKISRPIELNQVINAARRTSMRLNKQIVCIEIFKR